MTESSFPAPTRVQIQRMTERLLTNTISDEEFEYFEFLLFNSSEARQAYIEHVEIHSQLSYLSGAAAPIEEDVFAGRLNRGPVSLGRIGLLAGVLAGCLLVGGLLLAYQMVRHHQDRVAQAKMESEIPVGMMITSNQEPRQQQSSRHSPVSRGQVLAPRAASDYRFRLSNGVDCTLHGPARLSFRSPFEVQLDQGTLVANVPPGAIGFRVETPSAQIVDLGTTFSVSTNESGASELRVFQGAVSARSRSPQGLEAEPLLVSAHQTVQFSPIGEVQSVTIPSPDPNEVLRGLSQLYGIRQLEGAIALLPASPNSVQLGKLRSDTAIFLIHERSWTELSEPLQVVPPTAHTYSTPGHFTPLELPAGTRCDSFLLHCDFQQRTEPLSGRIVFDRPILGVIFSSDALQQSDRFVALKGLKYPSDADVFEKGLSRGCVSPYAGKSEMEDQVILHEDGHSLTVSLNSPGGNMDQIRVLVQAFDP